MLSPRFTRTKVRTVFLPAHHWLLDILPHSAAHWIAPLSNIYFAGETRSLSNDWQRDVSDSFQNCNNTGLYTQPISNYLPTKMTTRPGSSYHIHLATINWKMLICTNQMHATGISSLLRTIVITVVDNDNWRGEPDHNRDRKLINIKGRRVVTNNEIWLGKQNTEALSQ